VTDLAHIEALVGPLPKGREYEAHRQFRADEYDTDQVERDFADAALAEAYAVIERLAKMLRLTAGDSWDDGTFKELDQPMPDGYCEFFLADLARRAEEEADHD
jgi:hypothetical protein